MKKTIIILLVFCMFFRESKSQECLTTTNYSGFLEQIPSNEFVEASNNYVVRVFFHIMRKSDGSGGQSLSDIQTGLSYLVTDFEPMGICISLLGVDEIKNDNYYNNYNILSFSTDTDGDGKFDNFSPNSHANAVDIYIYPSTWTYPGGVSAGIPGSAIVIGGTAYSTNWAISHYLSHELGHCLGLLHTFRGSYCEPISCPELVNGSNCDECGDLVCDTPADPQNWSDFRGLCQWNNLDCQFTANPVDANGNTYNPSMTNNMAYVIPSCQNGFTSGQGLRMRQMLANYPGFLQNIIVPNTLVLTDINVGAGETRLYDVLNFLTVQGSSVVNSNGDLTLRAGESVKLKNNFKANANSHLRVYNDIACSTTDGNNSARNSITGNKTGVTKQPVLPAPESSPKAMQANPYPVPTRGMVYLRTFLPGPGEYELSIYNISGVKLKSGKTNVNSKGEHVFSMDLSQYPAGIYYLKVSNGRLVTIEKCIREN